jgi:hypothetical protein
MKVVVPSMKERDYETEVLYRLAFRDRVSRPANIIRASLKAVIKNNFFYKSKMIITGAEKETDKNIDYRPSRRAPPPNLSLKFAGRATRGHLFMQPRGLIVGVVY